jgi:FkbM family methyltransferase
MNKSPNHEIDNIGRVFTLTRVPANVRALQRVEHFLNRVTRSLTWRLRNWLVGANWISHRGQFIYRNRNSERHIAFNGQNMQFHALYDDCYRYGYELETGLLLTRLCRGDGAFYDIGSNWGYFSLLLAATPEFTGPVFAFEPNPRTYADLKDVIQQAGLAERVKPCAFGLGRESSNMALAETDRFHTGYARLVSNGPGQEIMVKRLDDLGLPTPQVIKIDAEGMEADILAGGATLLKNSQPFILFENFLDYTSPNRTFEPLQWLRGHGYQLLVPVLLFTVKGQTVMMTYGVDPGVLISADPNPKIGLFEVTPENRYLIGLQLNILAVPKAKMAWLWTAGFINLNEARP